MPCTKFQEHKIVSVYDQATGRYRIRRAVASDAEILLTLIRELAQFQGGEGEVKTTAGTLARQLSAGEPPFQAWIAFSLDDDQPAGFALCHPGYSTWKGAPTYYLEDLYLREECRRGSLARELMSAVRDEAVVRGAVRLQWHVQQDNVQAIRFYQKLGATHEAEWQLMHWPVWL